MRVHTLLMHEHTGLLPLLLLLLADLHEPHDSAGRDAAALRLGHSGRPTRAELVEVLVGEVRSGVGESVRGQQPQRLPRRHVGAVRRRCRSVCLVLVLLLLLLISIRPARHFAHLLLYTVARIERRSLPPPSSPNGSHPPQRRSLRGARDLRHEGRGGKRRRGEQRRVRGLSGGGVRHRHPALPPPLPLPRLRAHRAATDAGTMPGMQSTRRQHGENHEQQCHQRLKCLEHVKFTAFRKSSSATPLKK